MGQILSEPVRTKATSTGFNSRLIYGSSAMQGWRISMEDAHTTLLDVEGAENTSFFGVFDGHGGQRIAKYAGINTHRKVVSLQSFRDENFVTALEEGFLKMDEDMLKDPEYSTDVSGCTAVVCLITKDDRIYCANAGDSRCVLCTGGKAHPLSFDHKPDNEGESARIAKAGGFVHCGRVNGNLALSRAFGDFEFKQNAKMKAEEQIVTAFPEVTDRQISPDDEFLILACDGIWDCMTNQEVVDFIRSRIANGKDLGIIAEELMDNCLAKEAITVGIGCDNMTVIIVGFLNGGNWEQLVAKCSRPARGAANSSLTPNTASAASHMDVDTATPKGNAASPADAVATPDASDPSETATPLPTPVVSAEDDDEEDDAAL